MINWLSNLFRRAPSSAQVAKNRLKVVLSYDRTRISPELLSTLQDEIVTVLSQHLDVDRTGISVSTQRGANGDHLIADVPIRGLRQTRPAPAAQAPAPAPNPAPAPLPTRHRKRDRRRR